MSQEQKPRIGFRLARVESSAARVPSIARPIDIAAQIAIVTPEFLKFPIASPLSPRSLASLDWADAAATVAPVGFDDAWLEQAQALTVDVEAPAPIAEPISIAGQAFVTPPAATAIAPTATVSFTLDVALGTPELGALHNRIVNGPNPAAKTAPAPSPAIAPDNSAKLAPVQKKDEPKPAPAPVNKPAAVAPSEPKPQEPKKISIKQPEKTAKPDPRRAPAIAARSNAQPVEQPIAEEVKAPAPAPAPSVEPKVIPIRKPEPAIAASTRTDAIAAPSLTLGTASGSSSSLPKIGIAAALVLALAGGGYFMFRGGSSKTETVSAHTIDTSVALPPLGGGGWTSNWGADAPINKGKQISLYRPTMATADYRIELHGQIDRKAMGWLFRAKDPKNYYVIKLEQVKPGPDPVVALIKYSVINGKEGTHTQTIIDMPSSMTTLWRVRTDVKGTKFITYIQDKPVDYWTDDHLTAGGAGLYVDKGERALIKTTNISAL